MLLQLLLACLLLRQAGSALAQAPLEAPPALAMSARPIQPQVDDRSACNPAQRPPLRGQRLELRLPDAAELAASTNGHPVTEPYRWFHPARNGTEEERSLMADYAYPLLVQLAQAQLLNDPLYTACRLLSREENYGATPVAGCQAGDPIDDLEANPTGQAKFFFSFTSVVECRPPQAALPYEVNLLLKVSSDYETDAPGEFYNVAATWETLANV